MLETAIQISLRFHNHRRALAAADARGCQAILLFAATQSSRTFEGYSSKISKL